MQSGNKLLLILMALVLISVNIYAAAVCWDHIECDRNPLPSGVIMHYDPEIEIACKIVGLTPDLSHEGRIEVEILQPGYNGATLKQNLFINEDFINLSGNSIFFYLGRSMSPTYVNCYDTILKADREITRKNSLKHWAISFTKTWYESINPIPKGETWIVDSQNQILNKTGTVFDVNAVTTAKIEETTTQKENNDNRILLILFGILVCVLSVGIYILTYKKGYKIIGIGIWFSLSLFSLIILNDPYRLLSLIGIFFSIYLMIIWIKENAISIMKGKKDKI